MRILTPLTLADAHAMRGEGVYAAGLTALPLATRRTPRPDVLIDLSRVAALAGVTRDADMLRIGAMTALETIRCSSLVEASAPVVRSLLASVASLQVRHLATIGGNIVWGAGDLIPLLIAHRAIITRSGERMPLESAWDGGLIEAVLLPVRPPSWSYAEKVGFREAFSPSVVTVAASAHLAADRFNGSILSIGGGPNAPHRLMQAEIYLEGRRVADIDPESLRRIIRTEARCADGAGLTAAHRARIGANLLVAALMEAHE